MNKMAAKPLSLDELSLFSLEVVVDKMSIRNETCRFPAIAFRLLDFPTLIIYHVEPDLAESIKQKIQSDPYYKLPRQLPELQDKSGSFPVQKGKSCLFKVSTNTLQSHLMNTPLYVMLIDTYPEVPKLIGSCTVALDDTMDALYEDICNMGISVPSAHGAKGEYSAFNLMGSEIGSISLGVRLLSLGIGLIPHIPDHAIAKMQTKTTQIASNNLPKEAKRAKDTANIILHDIEAADQQINQVGVYPEVDKENIQLQTERETIQTVATQTAASARKSRKKPKELGGNASNEVVDDFFVTNTVCPPPLYFNSESEAPRVYQALHQSQLQTHAGASVDHDLGSSDDSEDGTIRAEDTFSDTDPGVASEKIAKEIVKAAGLEAQPKSPIVKRIVGPASSVVHGQQQAPSLPQLTQFPVLNALLQELVSMQTRPPQPQDIQPYRGEGKGKVTAKASPKSPRRVTDAKHFEPQQIKETGEEFTSRLSSPRRPQPTEAKGTPQKKGHEVCASDAGIVPKNMSWIRREPAMGVRKTNLTYGMTHSQKLRLSKGNPELLKTLEKDEEEKTRKKREMLAKKLNDRDYFKVPSSMTASPESKRNMHGTKYRQTPPAPQLRHAEESLALDLRDSSESYLPLHKRPVPTPRHSMSFGSKEPFPVVTPRHRPRRAQPSRDKLQELQVQDLDETPVQYAEDEHEESRSKSIEVQMPVMANMSADEAASVDSFALQSEVSDDDDDGAGLRKNFGKTRVLHGPSSPRFPRPTPKTANDSLRGHHASAIDGSTEEPELRKIVDHYSGDSEEEEHMHPFPAADSLDFGEEPMLRRVVDTYSDEDEGDPSYHSAKSRPMSEGSDLRLRLTAVPPNPSASVLSPVVASKQPLVATRQPVAASPSSPDEQRHDMSPDSTAYIAHSQSLGSTGESEEAEAAAHTRRQHSPRRPLPSPRLRRHPSVHTESLSSYLPSDPEDMSPISPLSPGLEEYSDNFEDSEGDQAGSDVPEAGKVADIQLDPKAKFGYTWGF